MKKLLVAFIVVSLTWSCTQNQQSGAPTNKIEKVTPPAGAGASLPYLIKGEDGKLYFSWVEKQDSNWVELKYSLLEGGQWTAPQVVAKGNDWFVNWADYPMIAADNSGNMMAHFLAKSSSGTYSYDVNVIYKPANGEWSSPVIPHRDGTPTEHGFVTMLPQNDGTFRLAWLDGRNTGGSEHDSHDEHGGGAMTLRSAVLNLKGELSQEVELDNRVCDCCQTGGVMTETGPVFVYRDRSELEIRDISFVTLANQKWSDPQTVSSDNWNISGCPVNGPRIASLGNSRAVAWFTASGGQAKVKVAFAEGSESFAEPIIVDETAPLGRVDVLLLGENKAVISWLDNDEIPTIKYRIVRSDGMMEDPVVVSETSESRGSGFPQMALAEGQIYFAWTNYDEEEGTEIMMASLKDFQ